MKNDDKMMRNFKALMERLQKAGIITGWSDVNPPNGDRRLVPYWNEEYRAPMGGQAAFLGFVTLLMDICPETPLSKDDQAMMVILGSEMEAGNFGFGNEYGPDSEE